MIKKVISIYLISSILFLVGTKNIFAASSDPNFKEHIDRVEKICKGGTIYPKNFVPIVKKMGEYKEASEDKTLSNDPFTNAKKIYRENMNNIYKCGLLKIQKSWLIHMQEDLLKLDETGELRKILEAKLKSQKQKLEAKSNSLCKNETNSNIKKDDKLEILNNSAQETCIYISYLEYLKKYYENIANLTKNMANNGANSAINQALEKINGISTINRINIMYNNIISEINNEENHVYRIYPIVFQSYLEYESNYGTHMLLQLLRDGYVVFRQKLHDVINPINQLVYKISNAMKK